MMTPPREKCCGMAGDRHAESNVKLCTLSTLNESYARIGGRQTKILDLPQVAGSQFDNPTIATMTRYAKALGKKVLVSLVEAAGE
jgi:hypothetical protein